MAVSFIPVCSIDISFANFSRYEICCELDMLKRVNVNVARVRKPLVIVNRMRYY